MSRLTLTLLLFAFVFPLSAKSQTVSARAEDCGCEAQKLPETLAVVNGVKITASDLNKSIGDSVNELQQRVVEARKRELDLMINSKLLALEAKKRGVTTVKLLDDEVVAKVKRPTQPEAQAFYDQNKARIQGEFKDVADDIITYLYQQRQQEEAKRFADTLRAANEVKINVSDVTAPATETDRARVLATIKDESITAADVETSLLPMISDVQDQVYKLRKDELELTINDTLLTQEAQKRKITTTALLDAEVKPKPVTEAQIQLFYDQNKERVSGDFTQVKDAIRQHLEQIELRQTERAFVEKLRAAASIQVFLAAPKQQNPGTPASNAVGSTLESPRTQIPR
jgi:hypothetical protein